MNFHWFINSLFYEHSIPNISTLSPFNDEATGINPMIESFKASISNVYINLTSGWPTGKAVNPAINLPFRCLASYDNRNTSSRHKRRP